MSRNAKGSFDVQMQPGRPELDGAVSRFELRKTFHGDLEAIGAGVMLSCGDPQSGSAGYVAIETVRGRLGDREGGFALQQLGLMRAGSQTLTTRWCPGLVTASCRTSRARFTSRLTMTALTASS